MNPSKLLTSLQVHEGCRLKSYQDSRGIWTIGYGRNLQELQITQEDADRWLSEDMLTAHEEAKKFPEYAFLDTEARQNAFTEMVFNLGAPRLRKFVKMLAAIRAQDWPEVSKQALDSSWHTQVGRRAEVLAKMLETGEFGE